MESSGEGSGIPLQYSCLENPTDGGGWWAVVHGVAKSQTRLSQTSPSHIGEGNGNPLQFLPGESQGRASLVGCRLWGRTEPDTTEATQQQQRIASVFTCYSFSVPESHPGAILSLVVTPPSSSWL